MLGYDTKVIFVFCGKFEIIGLACFQSVGLSKKKPQKILKRSMQTFFKAELQMVKGAVHNAWLRDNQMKN